MALIYARHAPRRSAGRRHPAPGVAEKRLLGRQCIRLDQHALQIELPKALPQHRPLVGLTGGVAGLADRHDQGYRVERQRGNEC
jgi:hypothetical protein